MKRLTLRVSDVEHEKVKEFAQYAEMSLNEAIREIIRRYDWKNQGH